MHGLQSTRVFRLFKFKSLQIGINLIKLFWTINKKEIVMYWWSETWYFVMTVLKVNLGHCMSMFRAWLFRVEVEIYLLQDWPNYISYIVKKLQSLIHQGFKFGYLFPTWVVQTGKLSVTLVSHMKTLVYKNFPLWWSC